MYNSDWFFAILFFASKVMNALFLLISDLLLVVMSIRLFARGKHHDSGGKNKNENSASVSSLVSKNLNKNEN